MSRAMMAGRISACPMTCWIPVALDRSTSSSGTVPPQKLQRAVGRVEHGSADRGDASFKCAI
eukprot:2551799-Heterocapsa_arctica.AAC.1